MKAKVIRSFCVVVSLLLAHSARAQAPADGESRFDALAKSVGPLIALATPGGSSGNHALDLRASIGEVAGLPPELKAARLHLAFEFPDKLLVEFPIAGTTAVLCRNGQSVWAFPASLFTPLVDQVGATVSTKPLPPFEIDQTKAALLPALLDVHDAGLVKLADESYRVLDLQLIGEIKTKEAGAWPARIWVRPADHRIAQLALRFRDWNATLLIEKLDLTPSLPPETWNPTPEQQPQVIAVPGEKLGKLLELALKRANTTSSRPE